MKELSTKKIGFVGGGAIAEALLGGLITAGIAREQLTASDVNPERRERLADALRVTAVEQNADVVRWADVIVLAVKPDVLPKVLAQLAHTEGLNLLHPLWVTIAAGVPMARVAELLPQGARIVRAMTNTPALVHAAATALCPNSHVLAEDTRAALELFDAVGLTWHAPQESLLDAVTGLSGSGPAFVFVFLEALCDAGVRCGLPREAAYRLSCQTVYGAAKLALETGKHPAELKDQVTSPAGTTSSGLERLEAGGFRSVVYSTVVGATERARELGRGE
jgi:pyrroline-5-carboxylate reductase